MLLYIYYYIYYYYYYYYYYHYQYYIYYSYLFSNLRLYPPIKQCTLWFIFCYFTEKFYLFCPRIYLSVHIIIFIWSWTDYCLKVFLSHFILSWFLYFFESCIRNVMEVVLNNEPYFTCFGPNSHSVSHQYFKSLTVSPAVKSSA